jgi:hypothetical protein
MLNESAKNVFIKTEQLHDGKWIWFRVTSISDLASAKEFLSAKIRK